MLIGNVYAAETTKVGTTVTNPLENSGIGSLGDLAGWALNIIIGIGWALTFIMLAAGFIKYILSRGETKATDQARQWLTFAALGGVGLFFLTTIKTIILGLLGAKEDGYIDNQFNPFNGS